MTDDWAEQCEHGTFRSDCPECAVADDVGPLFQVPPPTEVKPQAIPDAFADVDDGDLDAIFELFRTLVPPKDRIDRNLVDQQLRPILQEKGVKDAKAAVRDWYRAADEDDTLDAAVGVIPETVELPEGEQVDGRELLDDLIAFYARFMHASRADFLTVALWNLMTFGVDFFDIMALICFGAPDKACGKSTFLGLLFETAHRPMPSSAITGPGLFRAVDAFHPTLLIDEGDRAIESNEDLRAILNASHMRRHAMVMRLTGVNRDTPHWFSSWAPKAYTAIGPVRDDQISSRTIRIELERKPFDTRKEPARMRNIDLAGRGLRARCARWMADNALGMRSIDVPEIEGMADRLADNWEPMLAIARILGEDVYQEAVAAAGTHVDDTESVRELLLSHMRQVFEDKGMPEAVSTEAILRSLVDRDDGPWARRWADRVSTDNFKSAGSSLPKMLKPFKVGSHKIREGEATVRGYRRIDLEPVWKTYGSHPPTDERNNGTAQVDGGARTDHEIEAVPLFRDSDLQGSVVPSTPAHGGLCGVCGGDGVHWNWCTTNKEEG